jgi:hypothetical protein
MRRSDKVMRTAALWMTSLATVATMTLASAPARAEPATAQSFQLGLGFRYGADMNDANLNPWGPGVGLNLGYTMANAVYLGGNAEYFFGSSEESAGAKIEANIWQLSAEGGYDLGLGDSIVLRPKVGIGLASLQAEACLGAVCVDNSSTDFMLAPGGTFMLFTRSFSLSFDARYAMVFADAETAKGLIFSAGIGF